MSFLMSQDTGPQNEVSYYMNKDKANGEKWNERECVVQYNHQSLYGSVIILKAYTTDRQCLIAFKKSFNR